MALCKRILTGLLVICLLVTSVFSVGAFTPPPQVKGAVISIATRAWSALAYEYLERAVLRGMGEVANAAGDSTFGKVVSTAKKLLGNPTATAVGEVKALCTEILEELAVIEDKIDTCNTRLEELLAKFAYEDYEEAHKVIVSFKNTYTDVYGCYDTLITALNAYAESPTNDRLQSVRTAFDAVEAFYTDNTGALSDEHTETTFNFSSDLAAFLTVISPYAYGQTYAGDAQPSDTSCWGSLTTSDPTYMDLVHTYMAAAYPYEHEIYEGMMVAMNEVAATAALYLNAHRLFTEVGAQMVNADASLDEDTRARELTKLWNTYNRNSFRLMRGVEQMATVCHSHTATLMRPYDMDASIQMNVQSWIGTLRFRQLVDTDGESVVAYNLQADKTLQKHLRFYLVKSPTDNGVYAILQNGTANNWNADLNNTDLVEVIFEDLGATYTGVSGDFMNLRDSASPAGFRMLENADDLYELINVTGYDEHLYSFLSEHVYTQTEEGRVVLLPSAPAESGSFNSDDLRNGMMIPLYDDIINFEPSQILERDMVIEMINATQPLTVDDLSRNQIDMDTEDDISDSDKNHNSALVILRSDAPTATVSLNTDGNGSATLTDGNGNGVAGTALSSGTPLTLTVTPDGGNTVTAVDLELANGSTVSLVGESVSDTGETSVEEALTQALPDKNGAYTFRLPAPYQNATLHVRFAQADPSLKTYTAHIQNSDDGDIQFAGNNGIGHTTACAGETVSLHIRPYTGKAVDAVTIMTVDGTTVDATDVTANELVYTPSSKVFTFPMPAADVTVAVTFKDGYTVDLSTANGGTGCTASYTFSTANLFNNSWLSNTLTLEEGTEVTISATCPNSYYVDEFLITNLATSQSILGTVSGNSVTFTMPKSSVSAKVVFREITVGDYYVSLTTDGAGAVHFYDTYTHNSIRHHYVPGDTVTLQALTNKSFEPVLTAADVSGNTIPVTQDPTDPTLYTFVMPTANVNVHALFAVEVEVRIVEGLDSRDALHFSESTKTDILTTAWSGDKVYFYQPARSFDERALRIDSITAQHYYDNTPVEIFTESDGRYYVIPGTENVKIMASCVLEQYLTVDSSCADIFAVTEDASGFPGETVFFKQINTDCVVSELKVLDNAGRELPFHETLSGVYEVTLGSADATVYATVDSRQAVTYNFKNSQKFSYHLEGLLLDNGDGTGYAMPGAEMCLVISNDSSYPIAKFTESHGVTDADGNEIELTYKSGGTTSYYYFTMPDSPITVYGSSSYTSGFYEPTPTPLENGKSFTVNGITYRVNDDASRPPKVVVVDVDDNTATTVTVAAIVTWNEVAYHVTGIDCDTLRTHPTLLTVIIDTQSYTVREAATTIPPDTSTTAPTSPQTGDSHHTVALYMLVLLGGICTALLTRKRRLFR